jgi:hypothetical protein
MTVIATLGGRATPGLGRRSNGGGGYRKMVDRETPGNICKHIQLSDHHARSANRRLIAPGVHAEARSSKLLCSSASDAETTWKANRRE